MASTMMSSTRLSAGVSSTSLFRPRTASRATRLVVVRPRAESEGPGKTENRYVDQAVRGQVPIRDDSKEVDSFTRLEAPVRGKAPDGGPPVAERMNALDELLVKNDAPEEKSILGTEVAFPDAMRFKGAAPEVINCRLAMLGFALAVFGELTTGRDVISQFQSEPWFVVSTFLLFIVASLVPILRGYPRYGNAVFKPEAEINIGRVAMIGFAGLLLNEVIRGQAFFG